MSFKTVYLELTQDQKDRGVVYSSILIVTNRPDAKLVLHEVYGNDPDATRKIKNLENVRFFKSMAKDFGYDVINEVRR